MKCFKSDDFIILSDVMGSPQGVQEHFVRWVDDAVLSTMCTVEMSHHSLYSTLRVDCAERENLSST